MTRDEAITLAKTGFWKELTDREIAIFQLAEGKLCMPFKIYHKAVETVLGRPVFTHEFAKPEALMKELLGETKPPTLEEIIAKLPDSAKVILVKTP